jgi:hypothetical protein
VIYNPGSVFAPRTPRRSWPLSADGGEDAPMDEESNRFFKHLTIGALVLVALLGVVALVVR